MDWCFIHCAFSFDSAAVRVRCVPLAALPFFLSSFSLRYHGPFFPRRRSAWVTPANRLSDNARNFRCHAPCPPGKKRVGSKNGTPSVKQAAHSETRTASIKKKLMKNVSPVEAAAPANFVQPSSNPTTAQRKAQRLAIDAEARKQNRALPTEKILHLLRTSQPELYHLAEVVGRWVWVQFQAQPDAALRQQLSQLGFHWNRDRQAWQHPCGQFAARSPRDPHEKYASYYPADHQAA
jgi:hypothetical protein